MEIKRKAQTKPSKVLNFGPPIDIWGQWFLQNCYVLEESYKTWIHMDQFSANKRKE